MQKILSPPQFIPSKTISPPPSLFIGDLFFEAGFNLLFFGRSFSPQSRVIFLQAGGGDLWCFTPSIYKKPPRSLLSLSKFSVRIPMGRIHILAPSFFHIGFLRFAVISYFLRTTHFTASLGYISLSLSVYVCVGGWVCMSVCLGEYLRGLSR